MNYEKPDPLPKGWDAKTIEEFVEEGRAIGYGVLKPGPHVEGGVRLIKSNQVQDGWVDLSNDYRISPELDQEFKRTQLSGGELLLNVVGSIGRSAIAPPELKGANVSRAIAVLPLDKERAPWIQLFLSSPKCQADMFGRKVGIAQPVLNLGQVRQLRIPFPPLPEQRRIVAEIEKQFTRLEAGVAALRRVQANLKRYRAAVLKAACEGRLVPTEATRLKAKGRRLKDFESGEQLLKRILTERRQNWKGCGHYKEPAALDVAGLPRLPDGWAYCKMELLAEIIDPQPSHRTPPEVPNGIPYIGIGDVRKDGTIDLLNARKVSTEVFDEHKQRYQLRNGDFIVGKIGTVGKAVRLQQPFDYTLSANVVLIQPHPNSTHRGYIQMLLESPESQKSFSKGSRATTQAAFGIQKFRQLPISLPPLAEQTRIVAEVERRLSVVEELESVVTANLQRSTCLRQSILQRAFTGDL